MRDRKRAKRIPSVRIISVEEMANVAAELERASAPGTPPLEVTQVLAWAMTYADAYFRTPTGQLRRVFPKGRTEIAFRQYEKEKAHAAG